MLKGIKNNNAFILLIDTYSKSDVSFEELIDICEKNNMLIDREIIILKDRFKNNSLESVGRKIGVGKERVRQIQSSLLKRMIHPRFIREILSLINCPTSLQ